MKIVFEINSPTETLKDVMIALAQQNYQHTIELIEKNISSLEIKLN